MNFHKNKIWYLFTLKNVFVKDLPKFILLKLGLLDVFFESYRGMIEDSDSITNLK